MIIRYEDMAICSTFWIIICHNWNQWLEMKKWLNIIKYLSVLPFCQSSCCHLEKARNINYEKAIFVLLYWWFQKEGNRWTMQQGKGDRSIADGEGLKGRWVFLLSLCGGMFLKFNLFFLQSVTETMNSVWQLTSTTMIVVYFWWTAYNTDYHEQWCWQYAVNDDY